jgi:hypothetical protein
MVGVIRFVAVVGLFFASQNAFASVCGDVNGDGKVEMKDAQAMHAHVRGQQKLAASFASNADVNSDGKVDTTDVRLLADKVRGKPVSLRCPAQRRERFLPGFL